jgi:hypothetical protein
MQQNIAENDRVEKRFAMMRASCKGLRNGDWFIGEIERLTLLSGWTLRAGWEGKGRVHLNKS